MIANAACRECCLNNALKKAAALNLGEEELFALQSRIRELAGKISTSESAPSLLALLTDELRPYTDIDAPFRAIKEHFNALMLSLEDELYSDIEHSADPLSRAIQYAMTGNYIDFGALHKVSEDELARRRAAWVCPEPKIKTGYLARYAKLVSSADKGAILQ